MNPSLELTASSMKPKSSDRNIVNRSTAQAMYNLLHQLIQHQAEKTPQAVVLWHRGEQLNYAELWRQVEQTAQALQHLGLQAGQRVAVYLPKQFATVASLFATSLAGGIVVPINPGLKAAQVEHILQDCDVSPEILGTVYLIRNQGVTH